MHDRIDKSGETSGKSIYRRWGIGVFLLPVLLVAFLAGLSIIKPNVSGWITEAQQAELVSSGQATGGVPAPAVQPVREARTARAH